MMKFTVEETNLMCIYGADAEAESFVQSKNNLITSLEDMQEYISDDEVELSELTTSVIEKLKAMSNAEFEEIKEELVADFE